jgi:hypothetical protein
MNNPDLKAHVAVFPGCDGRISGTDLQRLRFFKMAASPAINASFLARDHFLS